jgi:fatty acid CoA ligase FadD9
MRALPEPQRQHSVLPLLHFYARPEKPLHGALASTEPFRAAVQDAKVGPDKDIPNITAPTITKYTTSLQLLGLL